MSVSDLNYPGNEQTRPRPLDSPAAGVDLWWCSLEADEGAATQLVRWLSPDERARVDRFGTPALARRYVAGRAALRWILASRAGMPPADIPIERGERGRPQWAGGGADFNVSHTRSVALIAIADAPGLRVGVDVEHAGRRVDHRGLARKYLTPAEQARIFQLDDDAHRRAFLRLWTCKEAMSKATGDALSAPFRRIDVALAPPALRVLAGPSPYEPTAWSLAEAQVPGGFLATVALWRR